MKLKQKVKISRLFGVIFVTSSLILGLFWRSALEAIMESQLRLTPASILYDIWKKNEIPIYLEIHLFNFTNADKFGYDKNMIPNFEEVGPFIFQESREKVGVFWSDFQETVNFNQTKKWQILPELSRNLSTDITNINPIATTIAYMSRLWKSKLQREIVSTLLNTYEPLISKASAEEWLFHGIHDEFLQLFEVLRRVTDIPIPYNRFGWFYGRNMSSTFDGTFSIKTGKSNSADLGMMVAWNNDSKTEHYEHICSLVFGTTGEIIPPLNPSQKSLPVFTSDICSYVTLKYSGISEAGGLRCFEYVGDESVFDNGTLYPENSCFYIGESCPSGQRNVSSCRFGAPAFISFPHFYLADPYYTKNLNGMNPDEKKHKFTLKVEPKTGVPLEVDGSFQINFLVEPFQGCDQFRNVSKLYIPMLWFRQTVKISEEYSTKLKVLLFIQESGGSLIFGTTFLIMFLMLTLSLIKNKYK